MSWWGAPLQLSEKPRVQFSCKIRRVNFVQLKKFLSDLLCSMFYGLKVCFEVFEIEMELVNCFTVFESLREDLI